MRGALNVFTVVVALQLLHAGDSGVAALSAAVGAGGLLGSLGVSLMVGSRHLGVWLAIALVLWGAPIAVIGVAPSEVGAFTLLAIVGLGNAIIDVPFFTLPVRLAADVLLARVFGLFESLVALGVGLGSVLTPALIALVDLRAAGHGRLAPAPARRLRWRRLAALDKRLRVRDEEIDVLRHADVRRCPSRASSTWPPACVDGRLRPVRRLRARGSGPRVLHRRRRRGGGGRRRFVVRHLGPGDSLGEKRSRDVPRTATVRAISDLDVFALERDAFLDAIGSHIPSGDAYAVVAEHLANFSPARIGI